MATPPPPPPRQIARIPPPPPGKIAPKKPKASQQAEIKAESSQKSRQRVLVRGWIQDALHTYSPDNAGDYADRMEDPKYDYLKDKIAQSSPAEFIASLIEAKEQSRVARPPIGRGAPPKPNIVLPPKLAFQPSPKEPLQKEEEGSKKIEKVEEEKSLPVVVEQEIQPKQSFQIEQGSVAQEREEILPKERETMKPKEREIMKPKEEKINELSKIASPLPKYPVKSREMSEQNIQESSRMRKKKAQNELRAAIASFDPMKQSSKMVRGGQVTQSFIYPSGYEGGPGAREASPSNISTSSRPSESQISEKQKKYGSRYYSRSTYTPNKQEPFNAQEIIKSRMSNKGVPSSRVTNSIATTPEELENMKEAYKNKKKELEETKRALTKAELQLKGEKQKVSSLQRENESLTSELHELREAENEQINALNHKYSASQKELKTKVSELQSMQQKLRKANQEREKEKQQLMEVTASFHKYKQEMDQTIQKLTSQREGVNQRQTARMASVSGVDRLRKQAQIYEKQLDKQKQEILKLKEENSKLQRLKAEEDQEKSEESYGEEQTPIKQNPEIQRNAESGTITFSSGSGLQEYQHLEMPPSSSGSADHRNHAIYPTLVNEDTGQLINFEESEGQVVGEDEERGEDQQQYMHLSESGGDFLDGENRNLRFFGWDQNEELKERENHKLEEEDFAFNREQEIEQSERQPQLGAAILGGGVSEARSLRNEGGSYHQSGSGGGKTDKRRERTGESGSTALIESNKRGQNQELKVQERERQEELMREEVRSGIGETHQREDIQQGSSGGNEQPRSMLTEHDSSHALFQFLDQHVSPANLRVTSEIPSQSSGEAAPASAKTHADNSDQIMRAPPSSNIFESSSRSPATIPNLDQESTGLHGLFQFQASDRDNQVLSSSGMMRDPAAPQQRSLNHNIGATGNCDENNESLQEETQQPHQQSPSMEYHDILGGEQFQESPQVQESEPSIPVNLFDEPAPNNASSQLIDFFASIQTSPQESHPHQSNETGNLDVFPSNLFGNASPPQQTSEPMSGLFESSGGESAFDNLWRKPGN